MVHKQVVLAIAILVAFSPAARGESLLVGAVELKLGMPEAEARQLLESRYTLSPQETGFTIADKRSTPPNIIVGRIAFSNGRVSWISRDLGPRDPKPSETWDGRVELASELMATLRRLSADGSRTGVVLVKELVRGPEADIDYIRFQFDQRALTLVITRGRYDSVTMEESIQAR